MNLTTVDHLLTTTRSVRKRLDLTRPVPAEILERCIEIALQAPTGSNSQEWHFMVITDAALREGIADLYRRGFDAYRNMRETTVPPQLQKSDPRYHQTLRILDSATYLAQHLHAVPVMVLAGLERRVENAGVTVQASAYGSILPAVWSFMLALRARGIGSAWTTIHLFYEKEVARLLGIPPHVTQVALLPVAYFTGADFKPAKRLPAADRTHWNAWGRRR